MRIIHVNVHIASLQCRPVSGDVVPKLRVLQVDLLARLLTVGLRRQHTRVHAASTYGSPDLNYWSQTAKNPESA